MSGSGARSEYQRARRDAEKAERRQAILSAASRLLPTTGFEGFSMSVLAQEAGLAKGTLYLYFETREEVLLALYIEALATWSRALRSGLREPMSDAAFVALFRSTATADPNFLTLRARLDSVIEHNVSREALVAAKRAMKELLADVAPEVERVLRLRPGTGTFLLVSLDALSLGAAEVSAGPRASGLGLPADVRDFMRQYTDRDVFLETAPLIVAGVRARGASPG